MTIKPLKIINSDYRTFFAAIAALSTIGIIYLEEYFGVMSSLHARYDTSTDPDRLSLLEFLNIVMPYACAALLFYVVMRILSFVKHFWKASIITGTITEIPSPAIGMGYLRYEYNVDDKHHQSENYVRRSRLVKTLSVGQEVEIVVNDRVPDRAYIRNLYT